MVTKWTRRRRWYLAIVVLLALVLIPVLVGPMLNHTSDVPKAFVGEWQRRTETLTIESDGTVLHWQAYSAQGCTTPALVWCSFNGELRLEVEESGTVATATYVKVWLTDEHSTKILPVAAVNGNFPKPGDVIRMEVVDNHLSTLMPSGKAFVFCSMQATDWQQKACY